MPPVILSPSSTGPTPAGVPVTIMSPALSAIDRDTIEMMSETGQISSARSASCFTTSFTASQMRPFVRRPTSPRIAPATRRTIEQAFAQQASEALIEVRAAGVNPVEMAMRQGLFHAAFPFKFPLVMGYDISGCWPRHRPTLPSRATRSTLGWLLPPPQSMASSTRSIGVRCTQRRKNGVSKAVGDHLESETRFPTFLPRFSSNSPGFPIPRWIRTGMRFFAPSHANDLKKVSCTAFNCAGSARPVRLIAAFAVLKACLSNERTRRT